MSKLNYGATVNLYDPIEIRATLINGMRERFIADGLDFFIKRVDIATKIGEKELITLVRNCLDQCKLLDKDDALMLGEYYLGPNIIEFSLYDPSKRALSESVTLNAGDKLKLFINLSRDSDMDDGDDENSNNEEILVCGMEAIGLKEIYTAFFKKLNEALDAHADRFKTSLVKWLFSDAHGTSEKIFKLQKDWTIDESYYPAITGGLMNYYKAFMESRANILVIYGTPGNGKTSFIRDMICEMKINAFISYDLKTLTSDSTFVQYMTDKIFNMIIIEDSDELLTSTRSENNKAIAKILNVSDGLIKLPRKKLIFTSNLPHIKDIDPAIIRAGRCFDVIEFKSLTREEAKKAMEKIGADITEDKKEYTLAELFAMKTIQTTNDPIVGKNLIKGRTIGFM